MSVYSMARNAQDGDAKSYLVALKDYIPAEALAIYVVAVGFVAPAKNATGQDLALVTLFALVIALIASAVIAIGTLKTTSGALPGNGMMGGKLSEVNRRRIAVVFVAWSALIAYVAATLQPMGITVATVDLSRFIAVLAFLWAVILPFVASWLGILKRS